MRSSAATTVVGYYNNNNNYNKAIIARYCCWFWLLCNTTEEFGCCWLDTGCCSLDPICPMCIWGVCWDWNELLDCSVFIVSCGLCRLSFRLNGLADFHAALGWFKIAESNFAAGDFEERGLYSKTIKTVWTCNYLRTYATGNFRTFEISISINKVFNQMAYQSRQELFSEPISCHISQHNSCHISCHIDSAKLSRSSASLLGECMLWHLCTSPNTHIFCFCTLVQLVALW